MSSRSLISLRARDWLSVGSLFVVFTLVGRSGTPSDLVLAFALFAIAVVVPAPLAFIVGHLAVLPTITAEDTLLFGLAQIGLLIVLTEPARRDGVVSVMALTGLGYLGLVGVVVAGLQRDLLVAGSLLCIAVVGGVYLMRRITLVRLGLVESETSSVQDANGQR